MTDRSRVAVSAAAVLIKKIVEGASRRNANPRGQGSIPVVAANFADKQ